MKITVTGPMYVWSVESTPQNPIQEISLFHSAERALEHLVDSAEGFQWETVTGTPISSEAQAIEVLETGARIFAVYSQEHQGGEPITWYRVLRKEVR